MPVTGYGTRTGAYGRLFCFLPLFLFAGAVVAEPDCALPWESRTAEVRRVVDGDTLLLTDGERVRLVGADAPELGRDGRPDQALARAAMQHMDTLIRLNDRRIELATGPEPRDRYGRLLAIVHGARHGDLAAHLIRNGLALAVAIPPNVDGFPCHLAAERAARAAGVGLWAQDTGPVVRAAALTNTGFAIIRGRAGEWRIRRDDRLLLLDDTFTLRFRNDDLVEWFADYPLDALAGRTIEVRGWVHPWGRGRYALTVQHPVTIEILDDAANDL